MNFRQVLFLSLALMTLGGCAAMGTPTVEEISYRSLTHSYAVRRVYDGAGSHALPMNAAGVGRVNAASRGVSTMNTCVIWNKTDLIVTELTVNGVRYPVPRLQHGDFVEVRVPQPECRWHRGERVCGNLVIQAKAWDTFEFASGNALPTGTRPQYAVRKIVPRYESSPCEEIALLSWDR
jgi:hypothetical protein